MKELSVILLCTWKFAATFPVAVYVLKMSFVETLVYTNIGGILGAIAFFYFSNLLIKLWNKYWPERFTFHRKKRKVFTKANRRFITIKNKYGLWGIVILSPVLLSIPLGAFLAAKYYGSKANVVMRLIAGQIFWSLIYTAFYTQIRTAIV